MNGIYPEERVVLRGSIWDGKRCHPCRIFLIQSFTSTKKNLSVE